VIVDGVSDVVRKYNLSEPSELKSFIRVGVRKLKEEIRKRMEEMEVDDVLFSPLAWRVDGEINGAPAKVWVINVDLPRNLRRFFPEGESCYKVYINGKLFAILVVEYWEDIEDGYVIYKRMLQEFSRIRKKARRREGFIPYRDLVCIPKDILNFMGWVTREVADRHLPDTFLKFFLNSPRELGFIKEDITFSLLVYDFLKQGKNFEEACREAYTIVKKITNHHRYVGRGGDKV